VGASLFPGMDPTVPGRDAGSLDRFVSAQAHVYAAVLAELRRGRKESHWMWFVFPQLAGLGHSDTARLYALGSIEEARAYLDHPLLGPRLAQCTREALLHAGAGAESLFGSVDALKFRSSMTLFAVASDGAPPFADALARFWNGLSDPRTLSLLGL